MSELDAIRHKAERLRRERNDFTSPGLATLAKLIEDLCDIIEADRVEAERAVHVPEASRA